MVSPRGKDGSGRRGASGRRCRTPRRPFFSTPKQLASLWCEHVCPTFVQEGRRSNMLRKLLPLLLPAPLAARAQSDWNDGQWSGDDEYSWQSDTPSPGDPRDGYAPPDRYGRPPPPADRNDDPRYDDGDSHYYDDEYRSEYGSSYGSQQYGPPPE